MAEKLGTSMSSKEINGDDATASQNIVNDDYMDSLSLLLAFLYW